MIYIYVCVYTHDKNFIVLLTGVVGYTNYSSAEE